MSLHYQNPVYPFDFADPFVLKTSKGYYAYGTASADFRRFPVLKSPDLVQWQRLGGALDPLTDPPGIAYWAPEVAEHQNHYFLFYSASTTLTDDSHRLRVAVATDPIGPFRDTGKALMPDLGFSIDASPFHDPRSGKWYLFFAMDFEHEEPYGTGLAVVELAGDLLSITSEPKAVLRAQGDWQIYERDRNYKGKLWSKWYCVEGPHCLFHQGRYYLFFSGGAWYGNDYGVGYAVADHPMGPWKYGDDSGGPSVLKGIPGKVIGPGHSCCVPGPDGKEMMLVYHAWDPLKTARRMCMDPIRWVNGSPRADGPSMDSRTL